MWDGIDWPPLPHAGLDRRFLGRPGPALRAPAPDGHEPQELVDRPGAHGFGQYFMGTTPAYMLASRCFRMTRPPIVVGGLAML